jgi:hypothetical protein
MIKEIFPEGQSIFKDKLQTPDFFPLVLDEIDRAGESFNGIMRIDESDAAYFLFFLNGDAYAAGCIKDGKTLPISIKDFLRQMSTVVEHRTISLFKTDPVLFKGMLVFLQREPSIKATTDMLNLDNILRQIKDEKITAFVILKKNNLHNFFYFHSGELKMAHSTDVSLPQEDFPDIEQMLLYAYPSDKTIVELMIYRDIKTSAAIDKGELKPLLITELVPPVSRPAREDRAMRVRIEITDGPNRGNKFNVPLPCTIGRRDADIRVRDMTVSRRHASLESSGGRIIFKDLDSTNGSMVNGKPVKEIELSDGDIIQIGNTTLKIQFVAT